jgi:glucose/arabinose dehydrogenase
MKPNGIVTAAFAAGLISTAAAQCSNVLTPTYQAPVVAAGWQAQLITNGLKKPRSIAWDNAGGLLVLDSGNGIVRYTFKDNGDTCLEVSSQNVLVNSPKLNHGLALSTDGKTLYASTVEAVFAWDYDASSGKVSGDNRTLINNMSNNDIVTRTLLVSQKEPGMLVVSRGGAGDDDLTAATVLGSGLSQIRAFNLANLTSDSKPYDFDNSGRVLGWGLRNSVGVAEHPVTGGIYSVENSIDGVTRNGTDIHENNPGEELNFHGYLNGSTAGNQGKNYGYPKCFAVWDPQEIPENAGLTVGTQFAMTENSTMTDETCASDYVPPRLTFPAHQAPLDIKFNADGSEAYVSFHGSFDTSSPTGYRVSVLAFNNQTGEPVAEASSTTALTDIISNKNVTECPGKCFRPVGLAWDAAGRLWMSSDTTGELYVLKKTSSTPTSSAPSSTSSGTLVTDTSKPDNAAGALFGKAPAALVLGAAVFVAGLLAL